MVENGGNDRIIIDFDEEDTQTPSKDFMTFIRDLEDECRVLVAQKNSMISKHTPERAFRIAELRRKIAEREEQIQTQLQKNAEMELIKQNAEKANPLGGEHVVQNAVIGEVVHGGDLSLNAASRSNPGSISIQADNTSDDTKVDSNKEVDSAGGLVQNIKTQSKRKHESVEGADVDKKPKEDMPPEPVKRVKFEFKKVGSFAGNEDNARVEDGSKENIFKLEADAKGPGDKKDVQEIAKTQTSLAQKLSLLQLLIKDPVILDRLVDTNSVSSRGCNSLVMPKTIENETRKKIHEIWKDSPDAGAQALQYTRFIPSEYSPQELDEKETAFTRLINRFLDIIRSLVANDKMMEIPVGSLISLLDNNSMSLLRKHFTLKSFLEQGSDRGLLPKTFIKNGIAVLPLDLPTDERRKGIGTSHPDSSMNMLQKGDHGKTKPVPLDLLKGKPKIAASLGHEQIKTLLAIKVETSIPHYDVHTENSLLISSQRGEKRGQTREPLFLKSLYFWPSVQSHARPHDLPPWMRDIFNNAQICKPTDMSNKALKDARDFIAKGDLGNSATEVLSLMGSVFLDLRSKKSLDVESFGTALKHQWDRKSGVRSSPMFVALMLGIASLTEERPIWHDELLGLLGSTPSYHGYIQAGYSFCPNIMRETEGNYLKGAFIMISGAAKIAELSESSERNADVILDLSLHHVHLQTMVPLKSRSITQFSELTATEQSLISTYYSSVFTALSRFPGKLCILLACLAQHYTGNPLPEPVAHHLGYPQPDQYPDSWCWRTRFPAKQSDFAMKQAQRILQQGLRILGNKKMVQSAAGNQDAFNIPKEVAIASLRSCILACQEKKNLTPSKKKKRLTTPKQKKGKKHTDTSKEALPLLQRCEQTSKCVEPLYWPSDFFFDSQHAANVSKDNRVPSQFMLNIVLEPRSQYDVRAISDLIAGIEVVDSELELKSLSDYIVTTMGYSPDASLLLVELLKRMSICFQLKPSKSPIKKTCFGYFLPVVVDSLWQAKPRVSEDIWTKAANLMRSVSLDSLSEIISLCVQKNQNNLSLFQELCELHPAIKAKI